MEEYNVEKIVLRRMASLNVPASLKHENIKIHEKGKRIVPNLKPLTPKWLQNIIWIIWRY